MHFILNRVRGERHRQIGDMSGLDVLDDCAVCLTDDQRNPESAAQEGVEIAGTNQIWVRNHFENVLGRPHAAHLCTGVRHSAYRSRPHYERHTFFDPQRREPSGSGVSHSEQVGIRELRAQYAAARQKGNAICRIGNVIPREQRTLVDATFVSVREAAKLGMAYGQTLQKPFRFDRAGQIRPAVEAPPLLLQPRAGNELLLHGPCLPPSTKVR